jgi:hypothetical protein
MASKRASGGTRDRRGAASAVRDRAAASTSTIRHLVRIARRDPGLFGGLMASFRETWSDVSIDDRGGIRQLMLLPKRDREVYVEMLLMTDDQIDALEATVQSQALSDMR